MLFILLSSSSIFCSSFSPTPSWSIYNNNMGLRMEQLRYSLAAFRTKKSYLAFHLVQLALSVAIIILALNSKAHFKTTAVLILELILFLTLAFDLLIVRWLSEGQLCHKKTNIFDLGLLCIFAATLIFLFIFSDQNQDGKDYRQFIETDDIIILVLVIGRYVGQIISLIYAVRNSKTNRELQKEIKNIDLNNIQANLSANFGNSIKADQMVRTKMRAKHELHEQK